MSKKCRNEERLSGNWYNKCPIVDVVFIILWLLPCCGRIPLRFILEVPSYDLLWIILFLLLSGYSGGGKERVCASVDDGNGIASVGVGIDLPGGSMSGIYRCVFTFTFW
jgi:hypothetical protein